MKLKLDENLGELGRDLLTAEGHDVSTVAMQRLSGSLDDALYEACRSEGRALITLDRDFGEVLRFPPEGTAGIAILACRGRLSPANILARIEDLAALLATESISGRLWIVEPGRIRIHATREQADRDQAFSP
jgi:predicted nuclease of predicted toxin-antitoxin system